MGVGVEVVTVCLLPPPHIVLYTASIWGRALESSVPTLACIVRMVYTGSQTYSLFLHASHHSLCPCLCWTVQAINVMLWALRIIDGRKLSMALGLIIYTHHCLVWGFPLRGGVAFLSCAFVIVILVLVHARCPKWLLSPPFSVHNCQCVQASIGRSSPPYYRGWRLALGRWGSNQQDNCP